MPTIMVRTSERASWLTCRQKWEWGWVDLLKPIEEAPPLEFGDYVHQALAAYYLPGRKRGPHPAVTFEKIVTKRIAETGAFGLWSEDEWILGTDLGVGMLEGYVKTWEAKDKEYEIISSEQVFQVPIGKMRIGEQTWKVIYVGTVDGVWRHLVGAKKRQRILRFLETKTTRAISKDALPMDEQVGAYWTYGPRALTLLGILRPTDRFDGVLYNYLRKAIPDDEHVRNADGHKLNKPKKDVLLDYYANNDIVRPAKATVDDLIADLTERGHQPLQLGEVSKNQDKPYFDRQMTYRGAGEAAQVQRRVMQQVREMIEARLDPAAHVYKNPGPSFMPNCRMCSFRDMCEVHETGNNWEIMIPALYTTWEPYSAHELPERY